MDGQSKRESVVMDERTCFQLAGRNPGSAAPVLAGVQGRGRLEGSLLDFVLRQVYRNTGDELLEVVYTFPLPHQSLPACARKARWWPVPTPNGSTNRRSPRAIFR